MKAVSIENLELFAAELKRRGIEYTTTAPTAANTDGLKIVVLSSEPATYYDGYLYIITGA